jgi:hypothetical protein
LNEKIATIKKKGKKKSAYQLRKEAENQKKIEAIRGL